jgi:HPt (histidine-containing phosphotransfer) domain-containing protein
MAQWPSTEASGAAGAGRDVGRPVSSDVPAFDAVEFDELSDMIGEEGVGEMVHIFEAETRQRLRRLEAGGQNLATQVREMHTLKGAAATVGAPRLATLGLLAEQAARQGTSPTADNLAAIADALEAFLAELRVRDRSREPAL